MVGARFVVDDHAPVVRSGEAVDLVTSDVLSFAGEGAVSLLALAVEGWDPAWCCSTTEVVCGRALGQGEGSRSVGFQDGC